MKPIRNHVHCPQCGKPKTQFSTKQEADLFIFYNAKEISDANGYAPVRSYFCDMCQCWHLTSHEYECRHDSQKNDRHLCFYDRFISRAVSVTVRLAIKDIKSKIHKINRYVLGHRCEAAGGMTRCREMYQEACDLLEKIRGSLSRVLLFGIEKRLKVVEPYLE